MRNKFFLLVLCASLFCSCAANPTVGSIFGSMGVQSIAADESFSLSIEYLTLSRAQNPYIAHVDGKDEAFTAIANAILAATHIKELPEAPYSPQARGEAAITFLRGGQELITCFYDYDANILSFRATREARGEYVEDYTHFTPGEELSRLLSDYEGRGAFAEEKTAQPYISTAQLKESINPDDLEEIGDAVEYRFYQGDPPERDFTACCVYSAGEVEGLGEDELLVVAYGRDSAAYQQVLWVLSVEENDYYIKVYVMAPDAETIAGVEEGSASNAVVISLGDISHDKWMVFIDEDYTITDVMRPQDFLPSR